VTSESRRVRSDGAILTVQQGNERSIIERMEEVQVSSGKGKGDWGDLEHVTFFVCHEQVHTDARSCLRRSITLTCRR